MASRKGCQGGEAFDFDFNVQAARVLPMSNQPDKADNLPANGKHKEPGTKLSPAFPGPAANPQTLRWNADASSAVLPLAKTGSTVKDTANLSQVKNKHPLSLSPLFLFKTLCLSLSV